MTSILIYAKNKSRMKISFDELNVLKATPNPCKIFLSNNKILNFTTDSITSCLNIIYRAVYH
jgi:hypothetical protein